MAQSENTLDVYLETGKRRTFAGAPAWPGWCRSGRDEQEALQTLLDYGPRYARVLDAGRLAFEAPTDLAALTVVERLEGSGTTDFGAPGAIPEADSRPLGEADLDHLQGVLRACWQAFDAARQDAVGKQLRKGPRGGGRDLEQMVRHVSESDESYLGRVGRKAAIKGEDPEEALQLTRQAILEALAAGARGELPEQGPRGGVRWPPRYFVRRVAWHVLDHAWEIEDMIL